MHTCPMSDGPKPHVGGPILPPCSTDVLIDSRPAARLMDQAVCTGPVDMIVVGSSSVQIDYRPAARMGDVTGHGGVIVIGSPTVMIG